ncbi:putative monooxygenase [Eremomyces bilateralis CBS 781.70]|uniref:Monooxygenase n=1 Tax=Eremomyces bilateralis CBS 781.70 TaxID=1392243 RepID=A0A6G1FVR8_9PEZI|nr:putative monooxygenase [Eremomyces bilateralis CBS 781.70]KAF1809761.1 putative monooxygenase [Eremomyces bilateralis CBS 781.70]
MDDQVKNLKICIAGAGMGGLSSALALARAGFQNIEVYELASDLGFVGAGIQLAPNLARILDRFGVWDPIEQESTGIKETSIRDGATDNELAHVMMPDIRQIYGFPHGTGHRYSLATGLYEGCKKYNAIKFIFRTGISSVESWSPKPVFTVTPRDGEPYTIEADILLGADGIKSATRTSMLAHLKVDAEIVETGQAAYRIVLDRKDMEHDPELLELINSDGVTRWIGEKRHIIAYPIQSKTIYNLSTVQPDNNFAEAPSITYTTKGSKEVMLKVFEDFCPKVQKMLNLVPEGEVCEWRLRVYAPLPTWVCGSVALVGDSCHATLPHLNQGAAQAIEDSAVLGVVLGRLPDVRPESINKALQIYESVRKERAETLVAIAAASGRALHLGSGAAKEERDKQFAALKAAGGKGPVPDKWADPEVQKEIYGHDCTKEAETAFQEQFNKL